jgi:hypothetical protein
MPDLEFERVVAELVESDPAAAVGDLGRVADPTVRSGLARSAFGRLAGLGRRDEALQVLEFYHGSDDPFAPYADPFSPFGELSEGIAALFEGWALDDPGAALAAIGRLPEEERSKPASAVWKSLARTDAEAALELARNSAAEIGLLGTHVVLSTLAEDNLDDAAARLATLLEAGESANAVSSSLVGHFAKELLKRRSPEDALGWAAGLGSEDARWRGIYTVVREWHRNRPAESSAWVTALADAAELDPGSGGEILDAAAAAMSETLREMDPELAFHWLMQRRPEERSGHDLQLVAGSWWDFDPDSARAGLEAAPVPEEAKARVRKELGWD